ncbi:hypothetical protein FKM82_013122 [Ascaphus truei]
MPEDWILLGFEERIQSSKEWLCDFRFIRVGWEMSCDRLSDLSCIWILWFLGSSQLKLKSPRTSSSLFSFREEMEPRNWVMSVRDCRGALGGR